MGLVLTWGESAIRGLAFLKKVAEMGSFELNSFSC